MGDGKRLREGPHLTIRPTPEDGLDAPRRWPKRGRHSAQTVWGDRKATCSVGWGGTRGHSNAVDQMRAEGKRVSLAHFNYINRCRTACATSSRSSAGSSSRAERRSVRQLRQNLQEFATNSTCEGLPFTVVELKEKFESLLKNAMAETIHPSGFQKRSGGTLVPRMR
ncbi:MAG: hypothetical protein ACLU5I_06590 [Alistipes finegoldii]